MTVRRVGLAQVRVWRLRVKQYFRGTFGEERGLDEAYYWGVQQLSDALIKSGREPDEAHGEAADKAMEEVMETAPPGVVRSLKIDAPRMLNEYRRLNAGFEKRLRQRWGTALDLYFMIAICCLEIGTEGYVAANSQGGDDNERALLEAVSGLQARACRTALEVHTLLQAGFPRGAQARARTIHELAVTAGVLTHFASVPGHEDIALRYLRFDQITNHMDAEEHQKHAERLGQDPLSEDEMVDIRAARQDALAMFPELDQPNGWAVGLPGLTKRPTFTQLEVLAQLDHLRPYYTWASHEVHANAKGVRLNLVDGFEGPVKLSGRTNVGLADPAQSALIALTQATTSMLAVRAVASPSRNVGSQAVLALLDEACDEFARIDRTMDQDL